IAPGVTLLRSRDLVNGEYSSNPLLDWENSHCARLGGCNRYGKDQKESLRYHNGTFYLLLSAPDEVTFLLTATAPEGPWDQRQLATDWEDPGLFFDNGKTYMVYGSGALRIVELNMDFETVPGTDQLIFT